MISELNKENCGALRQNNGVMVLIAYLNQTAYSRQLKALIELSESFSDMLKIYVTRDVTLKAAGNAAEITGTPTYLLLHNDSERDRLLGESDTKRLKNFIALNLASPPTPLRVVAHGLPAGAQKNRRPEAQSQARAGACGCITAKQERTPYDDA